jgi:hypothetical protein
MPLLGHADELSPGKIVMCEGRHGADFGSRFSWLLHKALSEKLLSACGDGR